MALAVEGMHSLKHLVGDDRKLAAEPGANASSKYLSTPHGQGCCKIEWDQHLQYLAIFNKLERSNYDVL